MILLYWLIPINTEMLIEFNAWLSSTVHIFTSFGESNRLILNASQSAAGTPRHSTNPCHATPRCLYVGRSDINLLNPWVDCIDFVKFKGCASTRSCLVDSGFPWGCSAALGFSCLSGKMSLQISLTMSKVAIS